MKKYEFMIYQLIIKHVESGHLFLADSIAFKNLSAYLVSDEAWHHKAALLKKLCNKKLLMPVDQLLEQTEDELENLIQLVNQQIKNASHKGINVKNNGDEITFTLPYQKVSRKSKSSCL